MKIKIRTLLVVFNAAFIILTAAVVLVLYAHTRSEERRVGKECGS